MSMEKEGLKDYLTAKNIRLSSLPTEISRGSTQDPKITSNKSIKWQMVGINIDKNKIPSQNCKDKAIESNTEKFISSSTRIKLYSIYFFPLKSTLFII